MKLRADDTICAIATAAGESALAVVRISGASALAVADSVFRGRSRLAHAGGFTVHHGWVIGPEGEKIDEALATVFRAPRSYTGEDMVELSCHGGLLMPAAVIEAVVGAGARQADPGEFTRRSFQNGRMDLARAEAVADLIASRSARGRRVSLAQLEGKLSFRVETLRSALVEVSSLLELELDFSEEGIDLLTREDLGQRLSGLKREISDLVLSYSAGRVAREGVNCVLVGKTNAGKSSLFNALLKEQRAIVTDIHGTTRDTLEESVVIDGVLFRLFDTAGLRDVQDPVEKEGVRRTHNAVEAADVVILVIDRSLQTFEEGLGTSPALREGQALMLVGNKIDLVQDHCAGTTVFGASGRRISAVNLSALTGEGVPSLVEMLARSVSGGAGDLESGVAVTNKRHHTALVSALGSLAEAESALERGESNEVIAYEVRSAANMLAEITGEVTSEEVLNAIFGRFCIGK